MNVCFTDIRVNTLQVRDGDVFFCSREAEPYLTTEIVDSVSKLVCEFGFLKRILKYKKLSPDCLKQNFHKIDLISYKEFDKKLVASLRERYKINSKIIAITGTKGKTSTSWFVCQLFAKNGFSCGYIGTLGVYFFDKDGDVTNIANSSLTTPNISDMYIFLNHLSQLGACFIVFEASSHSLKQKRIAGIDVDCACFTNLSQDHLDYHGTMRKYFSAKSLLFSRYLKKEDGIAIINNDDEKYKNILNICKRNNIKNILSFGTSKKCDLQILKEYNEHNNRVQVASIRFGDEKYNFSTDIIGSFQISNIALALMICCNVGNIPIYKLCNDVSLLKAPAGRMQKIYTSIKTNADFIIDFAHSPKSLEESLISLKKIYKYIVLVFGCGGDRDRQKRPIMFEIAKYLANKVIITDDNPRMENRDLIIDDILSYYRDDKKNDLLNNEFVENEIEKIRNKYKKQDDNNEVFLPIIVRDRQEAIKYAVKNFKNQKNTCIIIAGKGHENYQIIGKIKTYFSDENEIIKALQDK